MLSFSLGHARPHAVSHFFFPFFSLKDVETKLNDVAMEAGAQVDRLVNVVSQNGELQKKILSLLEDEVVQSIMTAIITTDRVSTET